MFDKIRHLNVFSVFAVAPTAAQSFAKNINDGNGLESFLIFLIATNIQTPTTLGWGFFLSAPASPREFARNAE